MKLSPTAQDHCAFGGAKLALSMSLGEGNLKVMVTQRLWHHNLCVTVQRGIQCRGPSSSKAAGDTVGKSFELCFTQTRPSLIRGDLVRGGDGKKIRHPCCCPVLHPPSVSVSLFSLASLLGEK